MTINALNYIASELHANFGPLFGSLSEEAKVAQLEKIGKKLQYVNDSMINDKSFLVGNKFSIADSYLYIVLSWRAFVGVDISPYPAVQAYADRIHGLPNVVAAHAKMANKPTTTA